MQSLMEQLAIDAQSMPVGAKVAAGLQTTVFSMVIVFAVLILLMYIIKAMGSVISAQENKKSQASSPSTNVATAPSQAVVTKTNDDEVVAAIMAAISSAYAGSDARIVIRNIEKKQDNWATVGLLEQMNSRL